MVTVFLVLFTTISLAFQLLPVISVPFTANLALSRYDNRAYGVFGWCYNAENGSKHCMSASIGYTDLYDNRIVHKVNLPSRLRYSFTKLLIVHPLSLGITFILWIMVILVLLPPFRSSPRYLLIVALYSTPAFLCCLLAFLIDILLFISQLDWIGWLVLASTVIMAICCFLLWTLRRSASIKKYEKLFSDDRVSSIQAYSMCELKSNANNMPSDSTQESGVEPLLEPHLTYRGSLD